MLGVISWREKYENSLMACQEQVGARAQMANKDSNLVAIVEQVDKDTGQPRPRAAMVDGSREALAHQFICIKIIPCSSCCKPPIIFSMSLGDRIWSESSFTPVRRKCLLLLLLNNHSNCTFPSWPTHSNMRACHGIVAIASVGHFPVLVGRLAVSKAGSLSDCILSISFCI